MKLFFSELGTEPRALPLLGKRSTTELNPQPHIYETLFLQCVVLAVIDVIGTNLACMTLTIGRQSSPPTTWLRNHISMAGFVFVFLGFFLPSLIVFQRGLTDSITDGNIAITASDTW